MQGGGGGGGSGGVRERDGIEERDLRRPTVNFNQDGRASKAKLSPPTGPVNRRTVRVFDVKGEGDSGKGVWGKKGSAGTVEEVSTVHKKEACFNNPLHSNLEESR